MDTSSITAAVLAVIGAGAIPGLAWMLRSGSEDRFKRIEKLADLAQKTRGISTLNKIVVAEIEFEEKRRRGQWKWKMLAVYIACAIPAGCIIGMMFVAFVPEAENWNLWWFLAPTAGISIVLAARNYVRSGPAFKQ